MTVFIINLFFYVFQSFHLQLNPPSGNSIPPANTGSVTQIVKIKNPSKVSILHDNDLDGPNIIMVSIDKFYF
jgi:hypothetical protein